MKINFLYSLKRNARAGEKCVEPKLELTMLLLLVVALALAGCETLESGSPGSAAAPSSPWPAAATGHSASYAGQTGFASSLSGQWYHDGKPTSITVDPDGRNLTIINEQGRRSDGYATSPREIEIPSLGIRGHISHSGHRISWTNGTEWTREARQSGSGFGQGTGQNLNGRWYHDGKPTSISVSSGGSVTITNEQGQSSRGSISGNQIVISGGIRGHVGQGGQRISWSNGTEWRR